MIEPDYIPVTAAAIIKNGKVLIAKRRRAFMGYSWEFPGGKLEGNETLEECLKREIKEELGVAIDVFQFLCSHKHVLNCQTAINLYAYEASYVSGDFHLKDHEEIQWVSINELDTYDFPEPDRQIADALMKKHGDAR